MPPTATATAAATQTQQHSAATEEQGCAHRELNWLLRSAGDTLTALRSGLQECVALLDSQAPASTLAFSSARSESLKGIVCRAGSRITRADLQVKMLGLSYPKGSQAYKLSLATGGRPLMLDQLTDVRNLVTLSLAQLRTDDVSFISDALLALDRLCFLQSNVMAARAALKGASPHRLFPYYAINALAFDPPLPPMVSFDLYISEASLVMELRTLSQASPETAKPSFSLPDIASPFGFRERFAAAVGFRGDVDTHNVGEETDVIFSYRGVNVKVKEKIRVESQDPSLMAVWAKLSSVEHALGAAIKSLRMVMVAANVLLG